MNCVNHPETPVSAYCQNCGKALCAECVRSINGVIYCEQCLAARLGMPSAGVPPGPTPMPPYEPGVPNPAAAAVLGFIPGVGAMYNGQFAKALIHVVVFAVLVGITNSHGIFGIFIGAWVLYQVFDASQTARARRDGLPLPDPFGLNELGNRMGMPAPGQAGHVPPRPPASPYPPAPPYAASFTGAAYDQPGPPTAPFAPSVPPVPPVPLVPPDAGARPEPIGAIVLIAVGMLFLFSTLGVFRFDWVGDGWPVIVILIGIWLLVRRTRGMRRPPAGGAQ